MSAADADADAAEEDAETESHRVDFSGSFVENAQCRSPDDRQRAHRNSDHDLRRWMEKMRGRCLVLESTPTTTVADAFWSEAAGTGRLLPSGGETIVLESTPAESTADVRSELVDAEHRIDEASRLRDGETTILENTPVESTADERNKLVYMEERMYEACHLREGEIAILENKPSATTADARSQLVDAAGRSFEFSVLRGGESMVLESTPRMSTADERTGVATNRVFDSEAIVSESTPEESRADARNQLRIYEGKRDSKPLGVWTRPKTNSVCSQDDLTRQRLESQCSDVAPSHAETERDQPKDEVHLARGTEESCTEERNPQAQERTSVEKETESSEALQTTELSVPDVPMRTRTHSPPQDAGTEEPSATESSKLSNSPTQNLRNNQAMNPIQRAERWGAKLPVGGKRSMSGESIPTKLLEVLSVNDSEKPGNLSAHNLAGAFVEKHMSWLPGPGADGGAEIRFFAVLAQLLRYHRPRLAAAVEAASRPASEDLSEQLYLMFRGATGLLQSLFMTRNDDESEALRMMCDIVVLKDHEHLMVFIVLLMLYEVSLPPSGTFEELAQLLHLAGLESLTARGASGIVRCVERAQALMVATPMSVAASLHPGKKQDNLRLRYPVTMVAPDEVLHHIYERPQGTWRFVVADVRCKEVVYALPVCIRLGADQDRRAVLGDLPYEDSIHLCLMGDGVAGAADEAVELCRFLTSPPVCRKHVSVIDGGWTAVQHLARSMGLDLLKIEPEDFSAPKRRERTVAREVAGQVQNVQKAAQKALGRATHGLHKLVAGEEGRQGRKNPEPANPVP